MTPDLIRQKLVNGPTGKPRGDDDLNPGMVPLRDPLTPAAVLVPLVLHKTGITLLLTRRTAHLVDHAGQISFPGGRVEKGDQNRVMTALRETEEEVGIHKRHVETIGELAPYITRTGFQVTPVVAFLTPPFEQKPDPFEVAEIFEVPLRFLLDRNNHRRACDTRNGVASFFYTMPYNDYYIWGATAGMIINLVDILSES